MSPEEIRHAYIIHISEDLESNPANAQLWRRSLLSVKCEFVFVESPTAMLLANRTQREKIQCMAENMV